MKTVDDANISEDSEHELLDEVDGGQQPIRSGILNEFIIFSNNYLRVIAPVELNFHWLT